VLVRAAAAQGLTMPLAAVLLLSAATLVSTDRGHFFLSLWALSLLVVLVTSFFVGFVLALKPNLFIRRNHKLNKQIQETQKQQMLI